jgi:hypothetical protein
MPQHGAPDLVRAKRYVLGLALVSIACARRSPTSPGLPTRPASSAADARFMRVSLGTTTTATITATSAWRLIDRDGRVVARGDSGERASVSAANAVIRLDRGPETSASFASPLSLVSVEGTKPVMMNGRRYRGT